MKKCVHVATIKYGDVFFFLIELWPFIIYNWLVLWDYTFYKWGFLSTYNWYFDP